MDTINGLKSGDFLSFSRKGVQFSIYDNSDKLNDCLGWVSVSSQEERLGFLQGIEAGGVFADTDCKNIYQFYHEILNPEVEAFNGELWGAEYCSGLSERTIKHLEEKQSSDRHNIDQLLAAIHRNYPLRQIIQNPGSWFQNQLKAPVGPETLTIWKKLFAAYKEKPADDLGITDISFFERYDRKAWLQLKIMSTIERLQLEMVSTIELIRVNGRVGKAYVLTPENTYNRLVKQWVNKLIEYGHESHAYDDVQEILFLIYSNGLSIPCMRAEKGNMLSTILSSFNAPTENMECLCVSFMDDIKACGHRLNFWYEIELPQEAPYSFQLIKGLLNEKLQAGGTYMDLVTDTPSEINCYDCHYIEVLGENLIKFSKNELGHEAAQLGLKWLRFFANDDRIASDVRNRLQEKLSSLLNKLLKASYLKHKESGTLTPERECWPVAISESLNNIEENGLDAWLDSNKRHIMSKYGYAVLEAFFVSKENAVGAVGEKEKLGYIQILHQCIEDLKSVSLENVSEADKQAYCRDLNGLVPKQWLKAIGNRKRVLEREIEVLNKVLKVSSELVNDLQ